MLLDGNGAWVLEPPQPAAALVLWLLPWLHSQVPGENVKFPNSRDALQSKSDKIPVSGQIL